MAGYHETIWPAQIIAIIMALFVLIALFRSFRYSDRLTGLVLALFWLWTGAFFYIREFSLLSFLAPVQGGFFVIQAALLFWFGGIRNKLSFQYRHNLKEWLGLVFFATALIIYPSIIAFYEGQWESFRLVGVTPFATTLFTLGSLFTMRTSKVLKSALMFIPILHLIASLATAWTLV